MPRVSSTTNELQTSNNYTTREYNYNISYVDNFDGFIPYRATSNTSDVNISYNDFIPYGTTLSNADTRIRYDLLDSVSLKCLESLKELQQSLWNACFNFKYNKKSKVFYNKI